MCALEVVVGCKCVSALGGGGGSVRLMCVDWVMVGCALSGGGGVSVFVHWVVVVASESGCADSVYLVFVH